MGDSTPPNVAPWRDRLHEIIFEADTPAGKAFDVALLLAIGLSVLVVMLDSVDRYRVTHHSVLLGAEWTFTILFTIEFVLRLICVRRPLRYVFSFFGVVDLLSILPTYVSLFLGPGVESLLVIRALRLLRVFRVFKLARSMSEARALWLAIRASRAKITVFLTSVVIIVMIMASAMYLIEGSPREGRPNGTTGFESIPHSMYWAVVTMTTVGYGDATPETVPGKMLASVMMLIGYSLIIVPTGILTAELAQSAGGRVVSTQACPSCSREGHDVDAVWCKYCGEGL